MSYTLYFRKQVVVNTDLQRRCYDGCNFSERVEWTAWDVVATYAEEAVAVDCASVFKEINPTREYKVEPQ